MSTTDKTATQASKGKSAVPTKAPAVKTAKAKPAATTQPAKPTKPAKKAAPVEAQATGKTPGKPRAKLVRDSFTMPQQDFDLIDLLKARALGLQRPAKKSELLRAGLQALAALPAAKLKERLDKLELLKTGRPKKSD